MSSKDYYKILGVSRDANQSELKSAFRKMAKEHHPDRHAGDKSAEQRFKEINEAYEVLKDTDKRAAYDRYGDAAFAGAQARRSANPGGGGESASAGFEDFADMFGSIFGDMGAMRRGRKSAASTAMRGANLSYNLSINLEELYLGKKQNIRYRTAVKCDTCQGSGSAASAGFSNCSACHGSGVVRMQQGFFIVEQTCSKCDGAGQVIKDPCKSCNGMGRLEKQKLVSITVPAGMAHGEQLRFAGQGEAGIRGGASGDLYVSISVEPHDFFVREGSDLKCEAHLQMTVAALGGAIDIPGIDHKMIKLKIPPGIQNATELRVKGKGMPIRGYSNKFGDLFVVINVETPVNLSEKQRNLLEEFHKHSKSENNSPKSQSFFSKLGSLFK